MGSSSASSSAGRPWAGGRNPRAGGEPTSGNRSAHRAAGRPLAAPSPGCWVRQRRAGPGPQGLGPRTPRSRILRLPTLRAPTLRARILRARILRPQILGSQLREPQRRVPPRRGARRRGGGVGEHGVGERCRRPGILVRPLPYVERRLGPRCTGPSSGSSPWAGCPASGLATDGAGSGVGHRFSDGWPAAGNSRSATVKSPGSATASGARTVHSPSPSTAPGRSPTSYRPSQAAAGPA